MTLAFLALLGAPYIYDISSLRVKRSLGEIVIALSCHEALNLLFFRNYVGVLSVSSGVVMAVP